jgi:hypothetical protein
MQPSRPLALLSLSLLLFCSLSSLPSAVHAQLQVPAPRTASSGDNAFNPASAAANEVDAFCGGSNRVKASIVDPLSTLYTGAQTVDEPNWVVIKFNTPPANADVSRFNFTLYSYRQNGTIYNAATNRTRGIFDLTAVTPLLVIDANITTGNNQQYIVRLPIENDALQCGQPYTGPDPEHSQTHCVLRYVYDSTRSTPATNSRVNCADVVLWPRSSDVSVSVRVALQGADDVPIGSSSALRRLLNSDWAQKDELHLDIFQTTEQATTGNQDRTAQQIRLRARDPIVRHADSTYTMYFSFSGTSRMSAQALADNFFAMGTTEMSRLFALQVTEAGISSGASNMAAPASLVTVLLAAFAALVLRSNAL